MSERQPAEPFVLIDDSRPGEGRSVLFEHPVGIVRCDDPLELDGAVEQIAEANAGGLYAAGFLSYELGYALEPKLAGLLPPRRRTPLLWFGLFPDARLLEPGEMAALFPPSKSSRAAIGTLSPSLDRGAYLGAFDRVKDYIVAGDAYQVNLTFKHSFDFCGKPVDIYGVLRRRQPVGHGAFVACEDGWVLSLSPELFIEVQDGVIQTRPMKGTAARGRTPEQNAVIREALHADPKSRAENLMIVDLLRNDLGRVAVLGSVEVTDLFTVEIYPTLHQMTSTIRARLRHGVGLGELLRALFPCGSVTGAPKIRAMEIIRELEAEPRGVYTGAVGLIEPGGDLRFNVAIRTLVLGRDGHGEMGIGSGIVYDSDGDAEYEECLLKARFLTEEVAGFELIETLRWDRGAGYFLLERHMERLAASARHFGFRFDEAAARRALDDEAARCAGACHRVRLTLAEDGCLNVASVPIAPPGGRQVFRYAVARARTDSTDPLLYHKTTCRALYESELAARRTETGCDEVIFLNEHGELTEGSYTNLFVEREGKLLTPPLACGLLDGTLRRSMLDDPNVAIEEAVLRLDDLDRAERVYLGNSVRGLVPAVPVDPVEAVTTPSRAIGAAGRRRR